MRELKFRAWDGKQFHFWGFGVEENTFVGPPSGNRGNPGTMPQEQFLGLKDKNGRDIYEGDIVRQGGRVVPVEWKHYANGQSAGKPYLLAGYNYTPECEVIGNIHESPELLK